MAKKKEPEEIIVADDELNLEAVEATKPDGMQKMFLSGPMTGYPDWNHAMFNKIAAEFRMAGFEVCSPSDFFGGDTTLERSMYMRESVKWLLEADTVILLPGWQESEGAKLEAKIAHELGLIIVEYVEDEHHRDQLDERDMQIFAKSQLIPLDEDGNEIVEVNGTFAAVEEDG